MRRAEPDPPRIARRTFDREDGSDLTAVFPEQHRVVQDLPEAETELACLVVGGQALHLRDHQRPAVIPGDVEVGCTSGRAKRGHAFQAYPRREGILRRRVRPEGPVDFIGVDGEWLARPCRRSLVRGLIIREDFLRRESERWHHLLCQLAALSCVC